MAERRMFAKTIVDSDAFLDMPLSTQALYFHLSMRADDEGFINNPKKIQRMIGASDDDLRLLTAKHFIIPFESGIVVIKHWRIHNYIRGDRLRETAYQDERSMLDVKSNGAYTLCQSNVSQMSDKCLTSDGQMTVKCQHRIGEDSIGEDRLGEDTPPPPKATRHKYGEYSNVLLSDEDLSKLQAEFPCDWANRIERLSSYIASTGKSYKNHLATIRNWARMDADKPQREQSSGNIFLDIAREEGYIT